MHCDPFTEDQIPLMIEALRNSRDRALFILGIGTGLRISELLQLKRRDLIDDTGTLRKRITVVHTKGDKPRTVPLAEQALPALSLWLRVQEQGGLMRGSDFVFTYGAGKPLRRDGAWRIIRSAARRAGLCPQWGGAFGTHSMRKTFARLVYLGWEERRADGEKIDPLLKCRDCLGHSVIENTTKYLGFMLGDTDEMIHGLQILPQKGKKLISGSKGIFCRLVPR